MWLECRLPQPLLEAVPSCLIEETRKLANLRMHIERVIGTTRQKYSILMSCMPYNFLKSNCSDDKPPIDKIVLVCSALNNCSSKGLIIFNC